MDGLLNSELFARCVPNAVGRVEYLGSEAGWRHVAPWQTSTLEPREICVEVVRLNLL